MASPAFYEKVAEVLAPRCAGGLGEVRALGEPLSEGALGRWVAAGLLGSPAAARLQVLADMDAVAIEAIEAVLSVGPEIDGSGEWDWESQADGTLSKVIGLAKPPAASWSDEDTLYDTGIVQPAHGPSLAGRARFDLSDRPSMRGRFAEVYLARDLLLGRDVAVHIRPMKSPLDSAGFVAAVRRQAALQHPAVQPIYELAEVTGPEKSPFFVTSLPLPDTLDGVINARARGGTAARTHWRTQTLLEALLDVARAVAFAHQNGTNHRDLRPAHVHLGTFGEVLLAGWFRARRWSDPSNRDRDEGLNEVGSGLGFLAPERLLGGLPAADARADVWGLGAFLYAILTDRPPFSGPSSSEVMDRIREGRLVPPGQVQGGVSLALEDLCLRALVLDPEGRRLNADEFVAQLDDHLDGNRAEERRVERARGLLQDAEAAAARYRQLRSAQNSARLPGRPPPLPGRQAEALAAQAEAFFQADDAFLRAQAALPGHRRALHGEAALYAQALQDAELAEQPAAGFLAGALAQLEALPGEPFLAADAHLTLRSDPPGAAVTLSVLADTDGHFRPGPARELGTCPCGPVSLPVGRIQLRLSLPDRPPVTTTLFLERGEVVDLQIELPAYWPDGAVYIPAGPCRLGSGRATDSAVGALPVARTRLSGFFISRTPVTLGEYRLFLDDLLRTAPAQAEAMAPRAFVGTPPFWTPTAEGHPLPFSTPEGGPYTADTPVVGVGPTQALAYAAWRAARDRVPWRLPEELEWVKAAGGDGRRHPWGDRFDPLACHARSGPHRTVPPPVGSAPLDCSPAGVCDLAGLVRELVTLSDGLPPVVPGAAIVLRGGSWLLPPSESAIPVRAALTPGTPLLALGFRLAASVGTPVVRVVETIPDWSLNLPPPPPTVEPQSQAGFRSEELTVEGRTLYLSGSGRPSQGRRPPPVAATEPLDNGPTRYELHEEIARGSMGRVVLAWDRVLRRQVALKILHDRHRTDPLPRYRFTMEARITGRLQHPVMLPVYDLGVLPDGRLFFAMRPVEGLSLRDVLQAQTTESAHSTLGRDRLLTVLRRICQGVAFAHTHHVVHRDLKPANVLIGTHGEVALVDLGLARQLTPDASDMNDVAEARQLARADGRVTRVGSVIGTPYYMSPEQAMGLQDLIGPPSDVYGLGALLYHVLAGRPPFAGSQVNEVLAQVRRGNPRPPGQFAADVPPALERIVMQALSMNPSQRPGSPMALADALQRYQESARMAEEHAEWAAGCARQCVEVCRRLEEATRQLEGRALRGEPRRVVEQAIHHNDGILAEAVRLGRLALAAGDLGGVHPLAERLAERCRQARADRDEHGLAFFRRLLASLDSQAVADLDAGAPLLVRTAPPGLPAQVVHGPAEDSLYDGSTPIRLPHVPLGAGRVIVRVEPRPVVLPFIVRRAEPVRLEVDIDAAPAGFVRVVAGHFLYGARRPEEDAQPLRSAWLPDYAIAIHPVTCGDWRDFLTDLARQPDEEGHAAGARQPRLWATGPRLFGRHALEAFGGFHSRRPISGITLADAQAYARWRSRRDGTSYRLPSSAEWEKAARGMDGRGWPWGEEPAPELQPGPVPNIGHWARDVSVYGMADIVGGVFEWTLTRSDEVRCFVRGHCPALPLVAPPCAQRLTRDPSHPSPLVGFRLVIGPPPGRPTGPMPTLSQLPPRKSEA